MPLDSDPVPSLPFQELLATGLVQDPGAVPLVVGVAGHRDPRPGDLPKLRQQFRGLLEALFARLPHTPLILLNGLAEGMDSEASEVFLELVAEQRERQPAAPRHRLVAALPKPRARYLAEDFSCSADSPPSAERQRLERLLAACDAVLDGDNCPELEPPEPPFGADPDAWDPRCYGRQGVFVVRHCYLLVAFSNGLDSGRIGGTSQTVAMQRGEVYPLFLQVDEVIAAREPGLVVEISTPRVSDGTRYCRVGAMRYWGENLDGSRIDATELASLEIGSLKALLESSSICSRLEQINAALEHCPPAPAHGGAIHSSLWRYADARATRTKRSYLYLCRLVMLLSVVVGLSISQQEWQAVGLLIVLAALVAFPKLQRGPKLEFIQWRCLAESLIVADHWSALAVNSDTADLFHSQTNQNFVWIRTILRARRLQLMAQHQHPDLRPPLPEAVECSRIWISDQEQWLVKQIRRQQRWDRSYLLAGAISFGLALALAIAYWLLRGGAVPPIWPETLIGIAVACLGYRELMGHNETNARYGRSRAQFSRARQALALARPDPQDPQMLQVRQRLVLEAVGREKIDELNDWVGDQLQRVYRPGG